MVVQSISLAPQRLQHGPRTLNWVNQSGRKLHETWKRIPVGAALCHADSWSRMFRIHGITPTSSRSYAEPAIRPPPSFYARR